jgi:transketolase
MGVFQLGWGPLVPHLSKVDIDRARRRLIKMHYESGVGHLGGNLSCIDALMILHHEVMASSDRFILSKGHSAGALYVTLWSLGKLSDADLGSFHQDGTLLAGHPPPKGIEDVRFATGSLGHGLSLATGLALAAKLNNFRRRVFCVTSDGEWQEGSTLEALVFAAHRGMANLTVLVDHNGLQGFGTTREVVSLDPLDHLFSNLRIELRRCNGHDLEAMRLALAPPTDCPLVVILETIKGKGVPDFEGRMESHYLPLTPSQFAAAMSMLSDV